MTVITRLRLDAAVYQPAPPRQPKQQGRPRKKGKRLPTLAQLQETAPTAWQSVTLPWYDHQPRQLSLVSGIAVWYHTGLPPVPIRWVLIHDPLAKPEFQALLSTDLCLSPQQILAFLIQRWQMEPTFRHVREHLGLETQRQWSAKAIARTTPVLLGLFSLVTVLADALLTRHDLTVHATAWYPKTLPTFSDALALVRLHLWTSFTFSMSLQEPTIVKIPRSLLDRFHELLCFTA